MFAPTKTWRRWHRKVNVSQKRYAICSAIAATGVPSLVMAKVRLTCPLDGQKVCFLMCKIRFSLIYINFGFICITLIAQLSQATLGYWVSNQEGRQTMGE